MSRFFFRLALDRIGSIARHLRSARVEAHCNAAVLVFEGMIRISDAQMKGVAHVSEEALLEEICRFARDELGEAVEHLDGELLRARVTRDRLAACDLGVERSDAVFAFVCLSLLLGDEAFYERPALRMAFAHAPDEAPMQLLRLLTEQASTLWPDDAEGEP